MPGRLVQPRISSTAPTPEVMWAKLLDLQNRVNGLGGGTAVGSSLVACRSTDSAQNKTTTLQIDDTLQIPMVSGAVYAVQGFIRYQGSVTSGFKFQLGGAAGQYSYRWENAGGGSAIAMQTYGSPNTTTIGTLNAAYFIGIYNGYVVENGTGNFRFSFAENASDTGNGAWISQQSYLMLTRVQ